MVNKLEDKCCRLAAPQLEAVWYALVSTTFIKDADSAVIRELIVISPGAVKHSF